MTLSWMPKAYDKDGSRYCSPACGHDCMAMDFINATKFATELATKMGPGWRPRVWENLGWHWEVEHPAAGVDVARHTRRSYWARIMVDGRQYQFTASSAKRAVDMLVRQMADHADALKGRILTLYPKS